MNWINKSATEVVNLDEIVHWRLLTKPADLPARMQLTLRNSGKEVVIWEDAEDLHAKLLEGYKNLTSKRQIL